MKNIILIMMIGFFVGVANTASSSTNSCSEVLAVSKESSSNIQNESLAITRIKNFCSDTQNITSDKITNNTKVEYEYVTGSVNVNNNLTVEMINDQRNEYCSATEGSQERKNSYETLVSKVNPMAYPAYSECLKMSKQNLKISIAGVGATNLNIEIHHGATEDVADAKMNVSFTGAMTGCKWSSGSTLDKETGNLILPPQTSNILKCTRDMKNGIADKATVTIMQKNSSDSSNTITLPWPSMNTRNEVIPTMSADINKNKTGINKNKTGINKNKTDINTVKDNLRASPVWLGGNNGTVTCKTWCGNKGRKCLAGFMAEGSSPRGCDLLGVDPYTTPHKEMFCVCQ